MSHFPSNDNEVSIEQYEKALQATKKPDKVGVASKVAGTAAGGAAGYGLASTIAGWFGGNMVTTTAVSSWLSWVPMSVLKLTGLTVATVTTPVSWVIGSTLACAGIAFGMLKLARSGGTEDERRRQLGTGIEKKIQEIKTKMQGWFHGGQGSTPISTGKQSELLEAIAEQFEILGKEGVLEPERVKRYVEGLKNGVIPLDAALNILKEHGRELIHPTLNPKNTDVNAELQKAAAARAFTVLHKGVIGETDTPGQGFTDAMEQRFGIDQGRALELYRDAPLAPHPGETAQEMGELLSGEVLHGAFIALQETAAHLARGQAAFVRFLEVQRALEAQWQEQMKKLDEAGDEAWSAIKRL